MYVGNTGHQVESLTKFEDNLKFSNYLEPPVLRSLVTREATFMQRY